MGGHVHEVIVENFKSYVGRVRVGPFQKFTCIVGANGAGKSNLVDAISFVLCVRVRHLRGDRLQDLINREDTDASEESQRRSASVELIYVADGYYGDAVGEAATEVSRTSRSLTFRRVVQAAGNSHFQVDGRSVAQSEYLKRLQEVNVLTEARNFLVFQGDVEAAAYRKDRELTYFFEQVSGSAALRSDYDQLAAEKAHKEDLARHLYARRRDGMNERRRLSHQKEEAEQYKGLQSEQLRLRLEFYLFRLHVLKCQAEDATLARARVQEEVQKVQIDMAAEQQVLDVAQHEHLEAVQIAKNADQALSEAYLAKKTLDPEHIEGNGMLSVLRDRLQALQAQAEKDAKRHGQLQLKADGLRREHASLANQLQDASAQARKEYPLTVAQREEFERARLGAEQQAFERTAQVRDVESQLHIRMANKVHSEQEAREATARCSNLERRVEQLAELESEFVLVHQRDVKEAEAKSKQLQKLRLDDQGHAEEKRRLKAERVQILKEIQDITATERQIEYERALAGVSADLKQRLPGVHGRILELCFPSSRHFRVAINVALGGYVDAAVTDTAEGARRCVQHLKDHMHAPLTFVPLDNLRVAPLDRRLQDAVRAKTGLHYALDCLSFKERYARIFNFLLGDVVIAENLEEGRRFVFEELRTQGLGCRLVTLDGEVISRDGNLAVSTDAVKEGRTSFDFVALERHKSRLEEIDQRLNEIDTMTGFIGDVDSQALHDEVSQLEARVNAGNQDLGRCRADLEARREDLRKAETDAVAIQAEADRLGREELHLRQEQDRLENALSQEVVGHFARLNAELGVPDVRRVERAWRRDREAAQALERDLECRLDDTQRECELTAAEQAQHERSMVDAREAVHKCEQDIQGLEAKQQLLNRDMNTHQDKVNELQAHRDSCIEQVRRGEKSVESSRQRLREQRERAMETERRLASLSSQLQALRDSWVELFRRSTWEDVTLPLLDGASPETFVFAGDEEERNFAVDFRGLPDARRAVRDSIIAAELEETYREDIKKLAGELERLRPNLKAIQQLLHVSEQVELAQRNAVLARRSIADIEVRFEAVRKERKTLFMACFDRVQEELKSVYKQLTGNGAHGGGTAYLDLEDLDDPFNGGVKFTAIPPLKRFCDINLLSGGERSLAALALLFAVQAFQRPPFLVLDEVDAHLDATHVRALAKFVEQSKCQTIVVSLKDRLFAQCDGLVGVTRSQRAAEGSVVFTWDLLRYRRSSTSGTE